MAKPNYITPEGLNRLKEEYLRLKTQERPQVVSAVAFAAANGDRSENADYIYGKRRLREIDRRLGFLQSRMEAAQVVDPTISKNDKKNNKVAFGAFVSIQDEDGVDKTYRIVGEDEIDAAKGWVSWLSPVAKALMGKKVGDEAVIHRPAGELSVEILKIEY